VEVYVLYVDRTIGQFRKRLASITTSNGSRVEVCVQLFNVTLLQSSALFGSKTVRFSMYGCSAFMCHPVN